MNAPLDHLIHTTLSDLAQEAVPVNLTQGAIDRARRRRVTKIALSAATVTTAVLIGAPLALAADHHALRPAAPSPSPTGTPSPRPTGTPSPRPTGTPSPRPTGTPSPSPTGMPSPSTTGMPSPTPTGAPSPIPTATGRATPSPMPTPTATPSPKG